MAGVVIVERLETPARPGRPRVSIRSGSHRYRVRYACCGRERVITRRSIRARLQAQAEGHPMACSICTRAAQRAQTPAAPVKPFAVREAIRQSNLSRREIARRLEAAPFAADRPPIQPDILDALGMPFIPPHTTAKGQTCRYIDHWPVITFSLEEKQRKQQPRGDY